MNEHESIPVEYAKLGDYAVLPNGSVNLLDTELALRLLLAVDRVMSSNRVPFPRVFQTEWECTAYLRLN